MDTTESLHKPARVGVWAAPLIALVWLSALLACIALLLYCWSLVKTAWTL